MTDTASDNALQVTTDLLLGRGYVEFNAKPSYELKRADRGFQSKILDADGTRYHITLWGYERHPNRHRTTWTWTAEVVTNRPWFRFEQLEPDLHTLGDIQQVENRCERFFLALECQHYSRHREATNG